MNTSDKRRSERFVSFAHIRIIDTEVFGYITNVSYTGMKTLLSASTVSLEQDSQYNLEVYAPELDLPRFSCTATVKWIKVIDTSHYEAGFEIQSFSNDTAKFLYGKLIENYIRF